MAMSSGPIDSRLPALVFRSSTDAARAKSTAATGEPSVPVTPTPS